MAADFDAGSIEGTLDLDNEPFLSGLLKAKAKADDFEHENIRPSLDLDKADFDAKKDEADVQIDELGAKKAEPEVKLKGVAGVLAGLGLINHEMKKTDKGGESAFAGMGIKLALLIPGILAVVAAMGPLTAVVVGFGVAAGVAFGGVILSLGLFALALKSTLGPVLAANKAGKDLSGWAGRAQDALKSLTGAWGKLTASVKPQMFHLIVMALGDLTSLLPKLAPLLRTVTEGLGGVVDAIAQVTRTKGFDQFLGTLRKFMGGFLQGLGPVLADALHIFMNLFTALQPLMSQLGHGILIAADATEKFTKHLKNGGIGGFIGQIEKFLPLLGKLAGDVVKSLGSLGRGLAPLSGPALKAIDAIVQAIGQLNLAPLAKGIADLLTALEPLLPVVARLINGGLKLLGPALSGVASALAFIESHQGVVAVLLGIGTAVGLMYGYIKAVALITKVWTAAQAALDVVLDANPIALIVVALAALAVGLIYAYKHSEKFRDIVNGAFKAVKNIAESVLHWLTGAVKNTIDFVKSHWVLLLSILTGPIGAAVIFLITHFSQIKNGFENLMGDVKSVVSNGVDAVVGFFTGLPGRIVALGGQMLNAGKSLMQHVFSGLESAASDVGGFASNIAGSIWNDLKSVLNNILPHTIHLSIPHFPDVNLPLFPYLASGGVTQGQMLANIGDNPGGQEAVIPLDKYDLPSKGQTAALASRAAAANAQIIGLLGTMVGLLAKGTDHEAAAAALGAVLKANSAQQTRDMIQAARAT